MSVEDRPGSVAEEIAALAEALRARSARSGTADRPGGRGRAEHDGGAHDHPGIDACEVCPLCRLMTALHAVSPAAVVALADLAHQTEVTLRTLAVDLQTARSAAEEPPAREDIPVDDLDGE